MRLITVPLLTLMLTLPAILPPSAAAQMGPGWGRDGSDRWQGRGGRTADHQRSREGRVSADHFVAEGAAALLGHGPVRIATMPDSTPESRDMLAYEASLIDRLVLAGYDTLPGTGGPVQVAGMRVRQIVAEPAEARRNPVSGEGSVMVSNRGTAVGMAVAVDFTDPLAALIVTHMDLSIKDSVTGETLWEARAQIATRDGDPDWGPDRIAAQLAAALFEDFPRGG